MQLFFQPGIPEGIHYLDPEESRHCIKVLRRKLNDTIDLVDGKGTFYQAIISETNPRKTAFTIVDQQTEKTGDYRIHLAVAPTKRLERIEWLVEKTTELGVDCISFIECQNSERNRIRLDRLYRKAISAMKQSHKATLPVIQDVITLNEFIEDTSGLLNDTDSNKFLAHLSKDSRPLTKLAAPAGSYCVLIGPEGDFSNEEIREAQEAGFQLISLGNSRLRTETAAMTAVAGLHFINE